MAAPSATPRAKPPSNVGCVLAIVLFPIVILGGLVLGTALRGEDDADGEVHVTLDGGEIGSVTWRVDAVRDVDGEVCAFLYRNDGDDPLTGGCSFEPEDATIGDQTVVFGRAEPDQPVVEVELDTGDVVEIQTFTAEDIEGRFYVEVVDGDVDAV
jgi:hypothetical protein